MTPLIALTATIALGILAARITILIRLSERQARTAGRHHHDTVEIVTADHRPARPYRTRPASLTTDTAPMDLREVTR